MHAPNVFEYTIIRVVPRVERAEALNAAVLLLCRERRFLGVQIQFNAAALHALAPDLDHDLLAEQLGHLTLICAGGRRAGPIGELPLYERFRWLAAPRSTVIQPGPVHGGLTADPAASLARLAGQYLAVR